MSEITIDSFLNWLTIDRCLSLLLAVMSILITFNGFIALYLDSPYVPQFLRTLILFGKFGKEKKLTKIQKRNSAHHGSFWTVACDGINSLLKRLEVPKSWFRHFYIYLFVIWILVVCTLWLNDFAFFNELSVCHLLLATELIQSCRRIYETQFVSIYSGTFSCNVYIC